MLAVEQRCCADQRTLGELFRFAVDGQHDVTLAHAMGCPMEQLASCDVADKVEVTDAAFASLDRFIDQQPAGVRLAFARIAERCA